MSNNKKTNLDNSEIKVNIIVALSVTIILIVIAFLAFGEKQEVKDNKETGKINSNIIINDNQKDKLLTGGGSLVQVNELKDDSEELAKELGVDLNKDDNEKVENKEVKDENTDSVNNDLPINNDLKVFTDKYIKVSSIILGYTKEQTVDKNNKLEVFLEKELTNILKDNKNAKIGIIEEKDGTIDNEIFWKLFTQFYQIDPS